MSDLQKTIESNEKLLADLYEQREEDRRRGDHKGERSTSKQIVIILEAIQELVEGI